MDVSAPEPAKEEAIRIGPARSWITHLCIINPLTWVILLFAAYGGSSHFRTFVYHALVGILGRGNLVSLYNWYNTGRGWEVTIGLGGAIVLGSYLVYRATTYRVDEYHVYKRTGLITVYEDPMAFSQILDANMVRGPFQRIFGTGTILLQIADQGSSRRLRVVKLHYVVCPLEVHDLIKRRYGGRSARILL